MDTQREFAQALAYEQATISRFENGHPFSAEAMKRIRELAAGLEIPWDNNWFFELPTWALDGAEPPEWLRIRKGGPEYAPAE